MDERRWVTLARIVRPQGRHGEVLADILTDFPERFAERKRVFLSRGPGEPSTAELTQHWLHKGRIVLKFAGVDSINDAEKLRGAEVVIPREERAPLEEDTVYISDLLGAEVFDVGSAAVVGIIADVIPEGTAPAMLVVDRPGSEGREDRELLIPFVKAYLRRVDLPARRIEMELPAGMLSINSPLTEEERRRMRAEQQDEPA